MLQRVVVLRERLLRVERWVHVHEAHLADVLRSELRQSRQAVQRGQRIATDKQVVVCSFRLRANITNSAGIVKEPHFSHAVVARWHPLVAAVLVSEQPLVLVRPGQLKPTLVARTGRHGCQMTWLGVEHVLSTAARMRHARS